MADLFVAPVIKKLIEIGSQYLEDHVRWPTGMEEELKRLSEKLPQIQAIVDYASGQYLMKDNNTALDEWLWQLRYVVDEADDVTDEIEYLKLKEEQLVKMGKRALEIDPTLKRLEEVVHKLDEVFSAHDVTTFIQLVEVAKNDHQEQQLELYRAREEGSLPKNDRIGRDREKDIVINWLSKTTNEYRATTRYRNISLLSVVGQGGMGKTTLLQQVYNHELTNLQFDLKMWVCVSNNFDVKRVIADMLESLEKERPCLESLNELQKTLKSKVKSQKFLLVLDDIWEEDICKWEAVLDSLASGKLGSKVLVTTRMESIATMLSNIIINKNNEMCILKGLKDEECLLLLNKYAFANVENLNLHQNLRLIAQKMVEKLSGSPLAARVIGGVLNSRLDEGHWMAVLNYEIGGQNEILLVLKLSYIFLPKDLRNCLSFCCTFPQDYKYDKDDLIHMWISLGFIQPPSNQGETMKDVGESYFDILVRKSLLDKFQVVDGRIYYKLHDLIHEMLRAFFVQQCFSIVGEIVDDEKLLLRNSETIRHLFVKTSSLDVLRKVEKFKNLRSFILDYSGQRVEDFCVVLADIFKIWKSIRLMDIYLNINYMGILPEEIGQLIHLRYLKIYKGTVELPASLGNLCHLKFMIYHCTLGSGSSLPRELNNLCNLLYLEQPNPGIHEIRKLNSLQELHVFYVQDGKSGYKLEELEHMNELRVLEIHLPRNLDDAKDASSAKLCDKRNLIDLSLQWPSHTSYGEVDLNENVLNNLQPHNSLKKLKLSNYKPARMNNVRWISNSNSNLSNSNLEYIELKDCPNLQTLPPFWNLPFLKYLYLSKMPKVKGFDYTFDGNDEVDVFPSLQVLHIIDLPALENLFVARAATTYKCLFPCLIEMRLLHYLNKFQAGKLDIFEDGWKGSNNWWMNNIHLFSKLECIEFKKIPYLQTLPSFCQLPFLKYLYLSDMPEVKGVDSTFDGIEKVRVFPSLQVLHIDKLPSLENLLVATAATSYECLPCLIELHLHHCPNLQELPSLPPKLEILEISNVGWKGSSWLQGISNYCSISIKDCPNLISLEGTTERCQLMLNELIINDPSILLMVPLRSVTSIRKLGIHYNNEVISFPREVEEWFLQVSSSLRDLRFKSLKLLESLPSSLEGFSLLKILHVEDVPELNMCLLRMPASLEQLKLVKLECQSSFPSSLQRFSLLKELHVEDVPQLRVLPKMPTSLNILTLKKLNFLPSIPYSLKKLSSLKKLCVEDVPQLRVLPNMPRSLKELHLESLQSLRNMPSSLPARLEHLSLRNIPLLQKLPDLPIYMKFLQIINCHPELKKHHQRNCHSYAHIPFVQICR